MLFTDFSRFERNLRGKSNLYIEKVANPTNMDQHLRGFRDEYRERVKEIWLAYRAGKYKNVLSLSSKLRYCSEIDVFPLWMTENEDFFQEVLLNPPFSIDFIFRQIAIVLSHQATPRTYNMISRLYEVLKEDFKLITP